LGRTVALLSETGGRNTPLGRAFVLLGALAFVAGGLTFAMSETLQLTAAARWTYRAAAGAFVGVALPALLHGLVLLGDTAQPTEGTSDIGILVCILAAGILLSPGTEAPRYVHPALLIYGFGILACVSAAIGALSTGDDVTTTAPDDRAVTSDDGIAGPDDAMTALVEDPPAD
jgi:hypothetical protein